MPLWTDVMDPATATGFARAALDDSDNQKASLVGYLPNEYVPDIVVRFSVGQAGLTQAADYRAFDAPSTVGGLTKGERRMIELPPLGRTIPISEYDQLRGRNITDALAAKLVENAITSAAKAVAERLEHMRGIVIETGKATLPGFGVADDFGRDATHDVTAAVLWADPTAKPLDDLRNWVDVYKDTNGDEPGAIVTSTQVLRALANAAGFRVKVEDSWRQAGTDEVNAILSANGLPAITVYDRKVNDGGVSKRITSAGKLFFLPTPTTPDGDSDFGKTYWGSTLTASDPDYQLAEVDQPGVVVGLYRGEKPPMITEAISDAIALPVLGNANLSLAATVLAA